MFVPFDWIIFLSIISSYLFICYFDHEQSTIIATQLANKSLNEEFCINPLNFEDHQSNSMNIWEMNDDILFLCRHRFHLFSIEKSFLWISMIFSWNILPKNCLCFHFSLILLICSTGEKKLNSSINNRLMIILIRDHELYQKWNWESTSVQP